MAEQTENIVGMRKKIKAQAEHIRRLEQRIRELKQTEPAPAQDEREAFITAAKHHKVEGLGFNLEATNSGSFRDNETRMLHEGWKLARANRPTQTEQQPIGWITEDYLTDKSATTYSPEVADRWRTKGWPVGEIYAAPSSPPLDRDSL